MALLESCIAAAALTSLAAASARLELTVGETRVLELPGTTELSVSRRGVIDVHPAGPSTYELTALRRGLVIVEARDTVTGDPVPPRYVVAVDDQANDTDVAPPPQALTAAAREALQAKIVALLGNGHAVQVGVGGQIIVETGCAPLSPGMRREHVGARLALVAPSAPLHLVCAEHRTGDVYEVQARLVATSDADASHAGGHDAPKARWQAGRGAAEAFTWRVAPTVSAGTDKARGEVVGEPFVRLATGDSIEVMSGGEFQVAPHAAPGTNGDAAVSHWREQGLSLKLTLQRAFDAALRLQYDMALRSQPSADAQELHHLSGSLPLTLNRPTLAGTIDVRRSATSEHWTQGLASIPIIGPLWRMTSADSAKTKLELWLTVRRPD
jgi:hypothetical protein